MGWKQAKAPPNTLELWSVATHEREALVRALRLIVRYQGAVVSAIASEIGCSPSEVKPILSSIRTVSERLKT